MSTPVTRGELREELMLLRGEIDEKLTNFAKVIIQATQEQIAASEQRLEAKLEATLEAKLESKLEAKLEKFERRFAQEMARQIGGILDHTRGELGVVDEKYADVPGRVRTLEEADLPDRVSKLEAEVFRPKPSRRRSRS